MTKKKAQRSFGDFADSISIPSQYGGATIFARASDSEEWEALATSDEAPTLVPVALMLSVFAEVMVLTVGTAIPLGDNGEPDPDEGARRLVVVLRFVGGSYWLGLRFDGQDEFFVLDSDDLDERIDEATRRAKLEAEGFADSSNEHFGLGGGTLSEIMREMAEGFAEYRRVVGAMFSTKGGK